MADKTYDLLIDTPENRKIAETLRRYNNIKDTNGEPTYLWKPPFISGQRNSLKGGSCCSECKMTGGAMPNSILEQMDERQTLQRPRGMVSPYTQPPAKYIISGNTPYYPFYNSVELDALENRKVKGSGFLGAMASQGIKSGAKYGVQAAKLGLQGAKQGAKIAVMVAKNPAVQAVVSEIAKDPEVQKAVVGQITTLIKGKATENIIEDAPALEGGRIRRMLKKMKGGMMTEEEKKVLEDNEKEIARFNTLAKQFANKAQVKADLARAKQFAEAQDIGAKASKKKYENKLAPVLEGPIMTPRGSKAQAEKFQKFLEAEQQSRGETSGSGIKDGRAKRAEIVKKVMKEHNLKMIEASSYVKKHNLY